MPLILDKCNLGKKLHQISSVAISLLHCICASAGRYSQSYHNTSTEQCLFYMSNETKMLLICRFVVFGMIRGSFLNLTCTVNNTRRLNGPMRGLHCLHPLHTKVIFPHVDISHRAVLDHLMYRRQCHSHATWRCISSPPPMQEPRQSTDELCSKLNLIIKDH